MRLTVLVLVAAACGAETRQPVPVAPVIPAAATAPASPVNAPQVPVVVQAPTLTPQENAKALCARLAKDTGTEWSAYVDDRGNEIRHLSPMKPVTFGSGSAEQRARAFFERYAAELHASDEELRIMPDQSGPEYVRFAHYLKGTELPVFLTVSSASFTKNGELYMTQPGFRAGLGALPRRASVSAADARKTVEAEWRRQCPNVTPANIAELALGVRGEPTLPPLLVWQATFSFAYDSGRCQMQHISIDAMTGAVAADH
ncbi:MAG TPA: hypothetical protein VLT33_49075 [Labilithrix sp.]|nr:hypothetical protein [Labilithrix sp.]